jgi:hypothetical protein
LGWAKQKPRDRRDKIFQNKAEMHANFKKSTTRVGHQKANQDEPTIFLSSKGTCARDKCRRVMNEKAPANINDSTANYAIPKESWDLKSHTSIFRREARLAKNLTADAVSE